MTTEEVRRFLSLLDSRELLISKLAIVGGMRPGEIFGLKWGHVREDHVEVRQRLYRGKVDSPKTTRSVREVALSCSLQGLMDKWRGISINTDSDAWVFPSEKLRTPLSKDNCWRRHIAPKLEGVGFGWVNFQVMRRTHSSLMKENNVDAKVVADQLGHSLDVNMNVYTQTALGRRKEAVNALESALGQSSTVEAAAPRVM